MRKRAIESGLIIAGLGPLLGFCVILAWVATTHSAEATNYLLRFPDFIVTAYAIGGLPAVLAGALAGWRVWRTGSITLRFWLIATAGFALVPSLVFIATRGPPSFMLVPITDEELAKLYTGATVFASAVLGVLLSATCLIRSTRQS
jgi:hypothetical protein